MESDEKPQIQPNSEPWVDMQKPMPNTMHMEHFTTWLEDLTVETCYFGDVTTRLYVVSRI